MLRKRALFFAPQTDTGGGVEIVNEDFEQAVKEEGDAAPSQFNSIDPNPDVEYVVEGTQPPAEEPDFARGKSREELLAIVQQNKADLEAEKARAASSATAIAEALRGVIPQPAKPTPVEGYRFAVPDPQQQGVSAGKSPAEIKAELDAAFIQDPSGTVDRITNEKLAGVVKTFGENVGLLGRELALGNPDLKKIYDRYPHEVEQIVAQTPVVQKLNNPRIYHQAIAAIKAQHFSEFVDEEVNAKVEAKVAEALKQYGIDPTKPGQTPAVGRPPVTGVRLAPAAAPQSTRRQVAIPAAVMAEAERTGKDPGMLYDLYKQRGFFQGGR